MYSYMYNHSAHRPAPMSASKFGRRFDAQGNGLTSGFSSPIRQGTLSNVNEVCCSVLQRVAVCCSVLQCVAVCCSILQCVAVCCNRLQNPAKCTAAHCTTLHHTAIHCNTLQHIVTHGNTRQHTATHCCTLQRTLQHSLQCTVERSRTRMYGCTMSSIHAIRWNI